MEIQNMQHYRILRLRGIPIPKYFCQSKLQDLQKQLIGIAYARFGENIFPCAKSFTYEKEGTYFWYNTSDNSTRIAFMPRQDWQKK